MEMQEMEISIDKEGRVIVQVSGAHGADCLALTKDIENATGIVEQREFTAEYYELPSEVRERQIRTF